MDDNRPGRRRYNEKEIGALIQRATELHDGTMGASEHSLSLKEIEHIATELGLPREHVQTAALEFENGRPSGKSFSFWGGPFVVDETRRVGGTMTEEQWADVVLELRRSTGRTGKISELGRAREWMHFIGESEDSVVFTKTQVTLRPGNDQTSIHVRKRFGGFAMLYVFPLCLAVFVTVVLSTAQPDLTGFLFAGGSVVGAFAAVRALISSYARRQRTRLKTLADRLLTTLSSGVTPVHEPASERIDIPEPDAPEGAATESRRGVRI